MGNSLLNTVRDIKEDTLALSRRCELLGVNRSSVYYTKDKGSARSCKSEKELEAIRKRSKEKEAMMKIIDDMHTDLPATGARKMAQEIRRAGYKCSRHKALRLMEEMNIKCIYPKPNTSKSSKAHPKFPYLLRGKKIWLPNQVWAIDITYVRCQSAHMYLSVIIDWYSRMVLNWALSDTLHCAPVVSCAKEAIARWGTPAIWNSDQGVHFSSKDYIELLFSHGIKQSMDGKGRWVDNVICERFFRTLKSEHLNIVEYDSPRQLRQQIDEFIIKYNERRLHQSLDYITPKQCFETAFKKAA